MATRRPPVTAAEAALLDRYTAMMVWLEEAAAPVAFRVVEGEERRATFRLRHDTAVREGWIRAGDAADGEERDDHDDHAVHVAGWVDGELVATARIVFPAPGRRLPVEQLFDLRAEPAGLVVDIGRTVLTEAHRDPQHRLFFALMARLWQEVDARGYRYMIGCTSERILDVYRRAGVALRVLGPPRPILGLSRWPFVVDALASAEEMLRLLGPSDPAAP